jgi:basic membrane protein A
MKRETIITAVTAFLTILACIGLYLFFSQEHSTSQMKVGFVYVDDASAAYTDNFIRTQNAIESSFGGQVQTIAKYNVPVERETEALTELVEEGCSLIFATSYDYGESTKEFAKNHPEVQFCQAACSNANEEPVLDNYHNFMGEIYQGRYVCGLVAGMKLQELIGQGKITAEQAKIGYVGAYPNEEVISGYTAFFLGVRSVVPEAVMTVKYTNSWNDYMLEKKCARELIDEGCVIISQHSDTTGPAVACEETDASKVVYHVGYNQSMADVAPTTYLAGCKINWTPYVLAAVEAVRSGKVIEDCVAGNVEGRNVSAGFDEDWVQMLELNDVTVAPGTAEQVAAAVDQLKKGKLTVFQGDDIGENTEDGITIE